jgi:cell wall-associated NlpC family hydrolase
VGDGQFVHAVDERHGVQISNLWDGYWSARFVGASREFA